MYEPIIDTLQTFLARRLTGTHHSAELTQTKTEAWEGGGLLQQQQDEDDEIAVKTIHDESVRMRYQQR
jgi:hypothetical protein